MNNRICAAAFLVLSVASAFAADCTRPPTPPAKSEWGFVRELATPPVRTPRERFRLADDYGCGDALKTALDDLGDFLGGRPFPHHRYLANILSSMSSSHISMNFLSSSLSSPMSSSMPGMRYA